MWGWTFHQPTEFFKDVFDGRLGQFLMDDRPME